MKHNQRKEDNTPMAKTSSTSSRSLPASRLYGLSSQQWERAFLKCASNTDSRRHREGLASSEDVIELVRSDANEDGRGTLDDLVEASGADDIVREVLEAFEIGRVGVEFPFSTHGDGISIEISRFPGGTAVGRSWDTSYGDSGIRFVIPRASEKQVRSEAYLALSDLQDGADWTLVDEDEELPDDTSAACFFGFKELEARWPKRKSSKKPPTKKARAQAERPSRSKERVTVKRGSRRTSTATRKRR